MITILQIHGPRFVVINRGIALFYSYSFLQLHYSFMYNVPAITGFAGFAIYDESPIGVNSNTFYIDDLVLLPYEYDYGVHIVDMCGQELSHSFSIDYVGGNVFSNILVYKINFPP